MAKLVFTNAYVLLNAVDLSDHVESITLNWTKNDVVVTAMGDLGEQHLPGIENNTLTVNFWQDFAANKVDATLKSILQGGTPVAFKVAATGSSFSSTNPTYSGSAILLDYQPLNGKVGDGLQTQVTIPVNGTITYGTA